LVIWTESPEAVPVTSEIRIKQQQNPDSLLSMLHNNDMPLCELIIRENMNKRSQALALTTQWSALHSIGLLDLKTSQELLISSRTTFTAPKPYAVESPTLLLRSCFSSIV